MAMLPGAFTAALYRHGTTWLPGGATRERANASRQTHCTPGTRWAGEGQEQKG
jgi:hypothetical protein